MKARISMCKLIFLFLSLLTLTVNAITIFNETKIPIYIRLYYQKDKGAMKVDGVAIIPARSSLDVDRPQRRIGYDRQLYFTYDKSVLTDTLTPEEMKKISSENIGLLKGVNFYITFIYSELRGFNQIQWMSQAVQDLVKKGAGTFTEAVKKAIDAVTAQLAKGYLKATDYFRTIPLLKNYPHEHESAAVRVGNELCLQEKNYLGVRKPKIKAALESMLNQEVPNDLTIAIVASGGGIRAMLATFGFLNGMEKTGLLKTVTYVCGLSGSTWAIAPWVTSGWQSPADVKQAIIPELIDGLSGFKSKRDLGAKIKDVGISLKSFSLGLNSLVRKFAFHEPITTVDFYGLLLANRLLAGMGDERQLIGLSSQAQRIAQGDLPLPIYTAVRAEADKKPDWYEFTPYEIGGAWLGLYTPTWAFGRKFQAGASTNFAPEQSLGFFMGIFGSAFALKFERFYQEALQEWYEKADKPNTMRDLVEYFIADKIGEKNLVTLGKKQITAAKVNNFTRGLVKSPISRNKYMGLCDAGLAFNLPYPPISGERPERKADIIIFLDASKEAATKAEALEGIEAYAKEHNLPFPKINYAGIKDKALRVFKNLDDPKSPVVLYMPVTNDKELQAQNLNKPEFADLKNLVAPFDYWKCMENTCDTFNFVYTELQANQLSALEEFNVRANKEAIAKEIKEYINRKAVQPVMEVPQQAAEAA